MTLAVFPKLLGSVGQDEGGSVLSVLLSVLIPHLGAAEPDVGRFIVVAVISAQVVSCFFHHGQ
jgi:hypothetical protein